jgi:glycosyltransferase involved in cell wall biosynthesis
MFLTSPDGGLAHYVAHVWGPISGYMDPVFVTFRRPGVDELVRGVVRDPHPLVEPEDPSSIRRVLGLAQGRHVGVVDLHSGTRTKQSPGYFVELLRGLRASGIHVVLHLHDLSVHRIGDADADAVAALCRDADSILVGSTRELRVLREMPSVAGKHLGLMFHGPYTLLDEGRIGPAEAREALGIAPEAPVILAFGSLRAEKRLDDLLAAFPLVQQRLPGAVLLVHSELRHVGGGALSAIQNQAARPGVRLSTGYAPLSRVEALFRAADVVALPYESVASSGVLNLARAFARPVVVTECFEPSLSIDGACGYRVPARDPQALAHALIRTLAVPSAERIRLGEGWSGILREETWANAARALWEACRITAATP